MILETRTTTVDGKTNYEGRVRVSKYGVLAQFRFGEIGPTSQEVVERAMAAFKEMK